jgi:hypothetical protein
MPHFHEFASVHVKDRVEHAGGELLTRSIGWHEHLVGDVAVHGDAGKDCLLCDGVYLALCVASRRFITIQRRGPPKDEVNDLLRLSKLIDWRGWRCGLWLLTFAKN